MGLDPMTTGFGGLCYMISTLSRLDDGSYPPFLIRLYNDTIRRNISG